MAGSRGRRVDASHFSMVPRTDVGRSAFDMHHTHKTAFDAGRLVPVYVEEVLPGDSFRVSLTALARLATPIVPVMDNLILESFFFFVPNRLVWSNWPRFMGEQLDPSDSTVFLIPQAEFDASEVGTGLSATSLADYMGITMAGAAVGSIAVNALPFRAYNLIWNTWFRDQDLQAPLPVPVGDGPDDATTHYAAPAFRGKRHDYFTSARPWPEKPINAQLFGQEGEPRIPGGAFAFTQNLLGAPVTGLGVLTSQGATAATINVFETGNRSNTYDVADGGFHTGTNIRMRAGAANAPDVRVLINDIRSANTIQLLMERNARGGSRYAEIIRAHFGVQSPDARLQRPEYLGGGRTFVNVAPIAQSSASGITGSTTVLGELAGIGTAVVTDHGFSGSFTEHGFILGLVNVRADLSYQHGVRRMWWRRTQYDFYWPALAHLGEQAILRREIWCDGTAGDDEVFGYQERWAEYRHHPNRVSSRMRSTSDAPLDVWHFSQDFAAAPTLNSFFIQENPPVDRVLQIEGGEGEQFLLDTFFSIRAVRPLPMFSIPGLGPRL